jgi:hypothetical protein
MGNAHERYEPFLVFCSVMNHGIGFVPVTGFTLLPEPEFVNVSLSRKLVQITYCTVLAEIFFKVPPTRIMEKITFP